MITQTAQDNAEIVRRAYESFDTAGVALLTEPMDERMTWHTPGRSPLAGDTRSREETFAQYGRYGGGTAGTFRAEFRTAAAIDDGRVIAMHHDTGEREGHTLGRRLLHRVRGRGRPDRLRARALRRPLRLGRLLGVAPRRGSLRGARDPSGRGSRASGRTAHVRRSRPGRADTDPVQWD